MGTIVEQSTNIRIWDTALVQTEKDERKENMKKKVVATGVVMICVAAVLYLGQSFWGSPSAATPLSQVAYGDFKVIAWTLIGVDVIATSGIVVTIIGLMS